jgi:HSP20 family protein
MNTPPRYQPEFSLTRLPDMIDQLFRESFVFPTRFERVFDWKRFSNLLETEKAYIVQLVLPGVEFNNVNVQVVGRQLTIKAVCDIPMVENATYLWNGLTSYEFSEVFTLPFEVVGDKAEATYDLGILTITLPKLEYAIPKPIKVHANKT